MCRIHIYIYIILLLKIQLIRKLDYKLGWDSDLRGKEQKKLEMCQWRKLNTMDFGLHLPLFDEHSFQTLQKSTENSIKKNPQNSKKKISKPLTPEIQCSRATQILEQWIYTPSSTTPSSYPLSPASSPSKSHDPRWSPE